MGLDTLPIGATIAGYTLEDVLGRGGMAVVYRATHPARGESVALKVIAPMASWDTRAQELFEEEARLAAAVVHRHILPVYEAGRHGDHPFVAMRMERCDLGALLRSKGRLSASHALVLVSQVASALDAAHAHGLVHRDIKPQNVLLGEEDGRECAYVADFGVARAAFSGPELFSDALFGTIGYAAPEQIRGEAVDQRSDVYALGCLVHELLTGRVPFASRGSLATLWAHLHDDAPALSLLRPDVPSGVDAVVQRALAKSPGERHGSAGAFAGALAEAVNGRSPQVRAEPREAAPLPTGTVTFLFTDVEGSTRLLHELGSEAYAEELAEHRRLIRVACTARRGVEVDTQGDAFFFAFTEAADALGAAAEAQSALSSTAIRVRIGIHSGQPHVTSEGYVGIDVHRAARIAASAYGGQVVLSTATAALVDDPELTSLGAHRLKDFDEPVTVFQLGAGSFPPLKTIANSNLPTPVSSFLGREDELYAADLLLQDARICTVHGPGGQGKTRFAIELARRAREERFSDYEDGVFACFLAPLRDPALVLGTIAQALSVSEQPGRSALETLASYLEGRQLLLLLDNLEHVLACARDLAELVAACPGLTLLITSRELARIAGEVAYELPPLAEDDGVTLFCERAQVAPSDTISSICARLEGLPLAIELAAARMRILSPEQLLERLSQRLDLLKGSRDADPRQQTLRATIQWSYDLLSPAEQTLFARLSVFAGGCTLEAAEEVCEAHLDTLESLLDKSLVRRMDGRIWMLETVREFAAERLEESGSRRSELLRHATHYARFVHEAEPNLETSGQGVWLDRLETEHDNIRSALQTCIDCSEPDLGIRISGSSASFWWVRGHWTEGRRWLDRVLTDHSARTSPVAKALEGAAHLAVRQGDLDRATDDAHASLAIFREHGDASGIARALRVLALVASAEVDYVRFRRLTEESAEHARTVDDLWALAMALNNLGYLALEEGDVPGGASLIEQAVEIASERGDLRSEAFFLENLALARLAERDAPRARVCFLRSLELAAHLGFVEVAAEDLVGLAGILAADGEFERAAVLLGAGRRLRATTGGALDVLEADLEARTLSQLEVVLGAEACSTALESGTSLSTDELIEVARFS